MANQTGRPIAPARKLVAAVMGTIAVFVMALGLGMSSWGVVFFGLALLALSIALGMVNMVRRGARAWVAGTAEVRAVSPPPASASVYGRAEIQAVIVAPGLPTSEVTIREPRVPVVKWPMIGDALPVMVDVDDMRRVRINWDEADPREVGADPPPPEPTGTYDETTDDLDSDLLGDVDPPPWATPEHPWGPPPPPPGGSTSETVVIRETPTGRIVEGEFVDHDVEETGSPLPRRAAPYPPSGGEPPFPGEGPSSPGRRPSPRPRGGTATATAEPTTATGSGPLLDDPEEPTAAARAESPPATATATRPATAPPQRAPHRDDDLPTDIPLDDPEPAGSTATGPTSVGADQAGRNPAGPSHDDPDLADQAARPASQAQRRPEPMPMSTTAAPAPTGPPPTAPPPVTPPPSAPAPSSPPPGSPPPGPARAESAASADPEIDLPLEADPVPPPESTPAAASALADDLIAPPAAPTPETPVHLTEPTDVRSTTRFSSNAAHEATVPTQQLNISRSDAPPPATESKTSHTGVLAGAAAAAAAAVAAVKKFGKSEKAPPERPARDASPEAAPAAVRAEPPAAVPAEMRTDASAAVPAETPAATPAPVPAQTHAEPSAAAPAGHPAAVAADAGTEPIPSAGTRAEAEPMRAETAPAAEKPAPAEPARAAVPEAPAAVPAEAPAGAAAGAAAAAAAASRPSRPDRGPWADLATDVQPDERADDVITAYPSARPGPGGAIFGVGITVLVTDLQRSVAFYRDTLGFFEIDHGDGSAVLASGDTRLVLRAVHNLSGEAGQPIHLNLEVGDVEAIYEDLRAKGVEFVHAPRPVNRGDRLELWSASFHDPDNHNIAVTQWRATS